MKKLLVPTLLLSFFSFALGQAPQQKPLTQAEYVRLLYEIQANIKSTAEVVRTVRRRGIGFALTSGIRGLTISKGRNNAELKRTLEEANRRRENPTRSKLPSAEEAAKLIEDTRQNTLQAVAEMPDFVVKQRIKRALGYAGTNKFRNQDRLIVAVSYLSKGQEEYKVLSVNGVRQENPASKSDYSEVKGTSSTGEFVSVLATIFKRESDTKFELVDTDMIGNRRTVIFDYAIEKDKAKQLITSQGYVSDSTITGTQGRLWIDREKARVLRVEGNATEIPANFPIRSAKRTISYAWVKINEETYLLPSLSDVRLTFRQRRDLLESKNLIHFKDYKKYGSEVIILDDDDDEIPESDPNAPPPLPKKGTKKKPGN